jgi:putative phosphoesterase
MRIAVISDTHMPRGTRRLPEACADRLHAADLVVHCGDVTGAAFWDELNALGPPVVGVRGNMDDPTLAAALPLTRVVEAGGAHIAMVHIPGPSAGREARLAARFPGCAAVVYGHTHAPQVDLRDGVWILNPGSPTERRRARTRTMLELRIDGGDVVPELVELGT